MSGGAMDYAYVKIDMAAEDVKGELLRIVQDEDSIEYFKAAPYYMQKYPFDRRMFSPEELRRDVVNKLKEAYAALRRASVYARRCEWLMSADDGYEAFVLRTERDLKQLEEELEAEFGDSNSKRNGDEQ